MAKKSRRKCKVCGEWFHPQYPNVVWCSPEHGAIYAIELRTREKNKAEAKRLKERKEAEKEGRQRRRARREELRPTSYFKTQAQQAFNAFIRFRDRDLPCISCGIINPPVLHGGQWDCGHFKSVGANPELRFEERNAHKQCKSCNGGAGNFTAKEATVTRNYEAGLVARYGQEYVDWLNGPHEMTNYRREDIIRLRDAYRMKLRELKKVMS
ncbi:recombination protein NinG [Salmonella enterica]|nr:recombination protein NinG [Salmonella enterica]EJX2428176.1 recombination protein NinG [Salmonella enterica]EJX3548599.1 recombination protein NinG [Salmonella enterica]